VGPVAAVEAAIAGLLIFQLCAVTVSLELRGGCPAVGVVVAPAFAIHNAPG
jgi:hypothetical protein